MDQESSEAFCMCDGAGGDGHWRGDGWNLATSPDEEGGHEQDHEEEQDHQEEQEEESPADEVLKFRNQ